jgi:hypothetical protein
MGLINISGLDKIPDDIKLLDSLVEGAIQQAHLALNDSIRTLNIDGSIRTLIDGLDGLLSRHEGKLKGLRIVISIEGAEESGDRVIR